MPLKPPTMEPLCTKNAVKIVLFQLIFQFSFIKETKKYRENKNIYRVRQKNNKIAQKRQIWSEKSTEMSEIWINCSL